MQPGQHLIQPVLQAPPDRFGPETQPLGQDGLQVFDLWPAVQTDHVHVDPVIFLQIGGGEQMRHDRFDIDTFGPWNHNQPGRIFMIGLIAQILDHWQLFGIHLSRNLLQQLRAGNLVGQCRYHDIAVFQLITGTHFDRTIAGRIQLLQFVRRRDDFGPGRVVRAFDMIEQQFQCRIRIIQQLHASGRHFP